jgi:virulence-associated protein VagC
MDKNKLLVCKTGNQVIICYNGKKVIEPLDKYKDLSKEEIKEQFLQEIEGR